MKKIYLAAPFFNPQQLETISTVEGICDKLQIPYFSPRKECLCPPDATLVQRQDTFFKNVNHIEIAPVILACIDDFDPGTIWEMGLAFRASKPIIAYTRVPSRGLNLMLAQSCVGFCQGLPALEKVLKEYSVEQLSRMKVGHLNVWKEEIV